MALDSLPDVVKAFLREFPRERLYWNQLAKITHDICQKRLDIQGIEAITTFRVKSHGSLKEKVGLYSVRRGGYKIKEEIYGDIPDFAGVRIALYIPSHKDLVDTIIKESFDVVRVVNHTRQSKKPRGRTAIKPFQGEYQSIFPGYSTRHYHVQLQQADVAEHDIGYTPGDTIEIQVVSAFQNVWVDIEHNIRYKTLGGSLTPEEHIILDCLHGLVQSGDILLNQLHNKYILRTTDEYRYPGEDWVSVFLLKFPVWQIKRPLLVERPIG
jgi:ppGpp synthetase/RelA/SpoT-type nucleotidyltranferase